MDDLLLIVGSDNPVIVDFAASASRSGARQLAVISSPAVCRRVGERAVRYTVEEFSTAHFLSAHTHQTVSTIVVFLSRRWTDGERNLLNAVAEIARHKAVERVCVVSNFLVHFDCPGAARAEAYVLDQLKPLACTAVLIRPGRVLSRHSRSGAALRALAFLAPLVPERFTSCFLDGDELFAAMQGEMAGPPRRHCRT